LGYCVNCCYIRYHGHMHVIHKQIAVSNRRRKLHIINVSFICVGHKFFHKFLLTAVCDGSSVNFQDHHSVSLKIHYDTLNYSSRMVHGHYRSLIRSDVSRRLSLLSAVLLVNVNVNVNMRFIVPPLLKEHGCIT